MASKKKASKPSRSRTGGKSAKGNIKDLPAGKKAKSVKGGTLVSTSKVEIGRPIGGAVSPGTIYAIKY